MSDRIIHITFSISLILSFLLFIVGSLKLFERKGPVSVSLKIFSGIIVLCMLCQIGAAMMVESYNLIQRLIGQFLVLAAIGLFVYCAHWLRYNAAHQLSPISVKSAPKNVFQEGPYRYFRHPLYTAYLLAFVGGAIGTHHLLSYLSAGLAGILYVNAAYLEEKRILNSNSGDIYRQYQLHTAMFSPKLFRFNQKKNKGLKPKEPAITKK